MSNVARSERVLPLLLAIAALMHFTFFVLKDNHLAGDSASYLGPAHSMASGDGFVDQTFRRTPGYPLFLLLFAPVGFSPAAVAFVQHLIAVLIVALSYRLGRTISGDWRVGAVAALLLTLDLPTLNMTNLVYTETLFTLVLLGSVICLMPVVTDATPREMRRCAAAGALMGWAVFTRPSGLAYLALVAGALLVASSRRKLLRVAVFVLCASLLPFFWAARNYRMTGHFTLSTIVAWNLYYDHVPAMLALDRPGDHREHVKALQKQMERELEPALGDASQVERSVTWSRKGREILAAHPWQTAKTHARATVLMFLTPGAGVITTGPLRPQLNRLLVVYTLPCMLFGCFGAWLLWRRARPAMWIVTAAIAAAMLTPAYGEAYSRFRVGIMPLYAIAVAAGMVALRDRVRSTSAVHHNRVAAPTIAEG